MSISTEGGANFRHDNATILQLLLQLLEKINNSGIGLAILSYMVGKKLKFYIRKVMQSRYFSVITLGSLWLMLQLLQMNIDLEPNYSLHLSSQTTSTQYLEEYLYPSPAAMALQAEKSYDLQLRIQIPYNTIVNKKSVTLSRNTLLTLNVPKSALEEARVDGQVDLKKVNLNNVIQNINKKLDDGMFKIPRNEVSIAETQDKNLIGESTEIPLSLLAKNNQIKIESIESENEESEGSVCVNCEGEEESSIVASFIKKLTGSDKFQMYSLDGIVKSYEESEEVKKLMATAKKGYRARRGRRTVYPRSTRVSKSIGACYNGVKTLLQKSGIVNSYFSGNAAKGAGPQLEKHGFVNLLDTEYKDKIKTPYDAPLGSVLVYEGDSKTRPRYDPNYRYGHIEVRTEKGFISDYYSTKARTDSALAANGRKLIGVYIKASPQMENYLAYNESEGKN